jgi:PAS domain S-box-containing protein
VSECLNTVGIVEEVGMAVEGRHPTALAPATSAVWAFTNEATMVPSKEFQHANVPILPGTTESVRFVPPAGTFAESLQGLAEQARLLIGAHQAVLRVAVDEHWSDVVTATSYSEKYGSWPSGASAGKEAGVDALWCPVFRPMRMTQEELAAHPAWRVLRAGTGKRPPLRGWLAVPLLDPQGRAFGAVEISDKNEGDFDANDERRLVQFAQVIAVALENARPAAPRPAQVADQVHAVPAIHSEIGEILLRGGDLGDALQECAAALVRRLNVALLRLWVRQGAVLELKASAGLFTHLDGPNARVPLGQGRVGQIAITLQPVVSTELTAQAHPIDMEWIRREGIQAFAGYPLRDDDDVQGVLTVFDRDPISPAVQQALAMVAHPLALFIKRHAHQLSPVAPRSTPQPVASAPVIVEHAVIFTNLDGTVTDWNRGAERLFGYSRQDMLGKRIAKLAPRERAKEDRDLLQATARNECAILQNTQRLRKDGSAVDLCLSVSPNRGHAGNPVGAVFVAHDISEMRRLQQLFVAAQKMEVFGHLTGGVAHDFNNLLTVILGYSEILLRRFNTEDAAHDLVGEIRKAGQRAETLTRQLLAFSRRRVIDPQVLDLNATIGECEKMLRRLIGEEILISTILAPTLKPVRVDPGQIQQVILNLAINARDAMPKGGRLTIHTDNVMLNEEYARSRPGARAGAYVVLAIGDTGIGMSPETRARIFEPLFTTKGPGKGTGLGLATVASIVKAAGGHIDVESEFGKGTTFKIYLPQVLDAQPSSKAHSGLHAIPRGTETILLVEDEDSVRNLARHVLETCGYRVLEASNGEEGARRYERHEGPIQLLITDMVMPYLGGRALAANLRAVDPRLKVLFLSGYSADETVQQGVGEQDFAHLQKPFTIRALAQKVRDILDTP